MPRNTEDRLTTTTHRNPICGRFGTSLLFTNRETNVSVFFRAWKQVHEDFGMWADENKGMSHKEISSLYKITIWQVKSRLSTIKKVTNAIHRKLRGQDISREDMERLVTYTDYLRGPIGVKWATQLNARDGKREQEKYDQLMFDAYGIWPAKYSGYRPDETSGRSKGSGTMQSSDPA